MCVRACVFVCMCVSEGAGMRGWGVVDCLSNGISVIRKDAVKPFLYFLRVPFKYFILRHCSWYNVL